MKFGRFAVTFSRGFLFVGLDEYDAVEIALFVVTPVNVVTSE